MIPGSDAFGFHEECLFLQLKCDLLVGGQDHAYSFRNARNGEDAAQRLQRFVHWEISIFILGAPKFEEQRSSTLLSSH
jgi:hypothetical protein